MKRIERRVFFEFNGFEGLDDGKTIIDGKAVKLFSRNFDKILNLLISKIQTVGVNIKNGYVDISSTALKSAFDNYKPYIRYLIINGYLERSYFVYKVKGKSNPEYFKKDYIKNKPFGYRFTEHFKQWVTIKRVIFVPKNHNIPVASNVEKSPESKLSINVILNPVIIKRLKRDFNSCQILLNDIEKTNFQQSKFIDVGKWFYNKSELYKWKRGDKTFKFSSKRLYTNFTRLSSHVRLSNIQLNNQFLKFKDISNSFPLMLAVYYIKNNPALAHDTDFIEYCSWVTTGTFYLKLTEGLNNGRNSDEKDRQAVKRSKKLKDNTSEIADIKSKRVFTKDIVKVIFQIYLNGMVDGIPHIEGYGNSLINDYMKLKFSCVHEQIIHIKENQQNIYDVLVKEESGFIFKVIGQLYKKCDSIKLLTVHDSIYTAESDFDKLDTEWNKQFEQLIALLPAESVTQIENIIKPDSIEVEELDFVDDEEDLSNSIGFSSIRRMNKQFFEDDENDFFDWDLYS